MDIPRPQKGEFTIYSKSGCVNCNKIKKLLKDNSFLFRVIDCDDFLIENKSVFLDSMETLCGKRVTTFPMVFDGNIFLGGYEQTVSYINELNDFFAEMI